MILLEQLFSNDPMLSVFIFATILLIGGLPHGALDFFILKNIFKRKIFISSLIIYLFIATIFYILFFLFPEIIFIIFLTYSAFHFGDSDFKDESQISKLGWGSMIICIPLLVDIKNADLKAHGFKRSIAGKN